MSEKNNPELINGSEPRTEGTLAGADREIPRVFTLVPPGAGLRRLLSAVDLMAVAAVLVCYGCALMWGAFDWLSMLVRLVAVTAVPFIFVSLLRRAFNAPRPYELYPLEGFEGAKRGSSFPSRHVFSAALIGSALCHVSLALGIISLISAIALGACRVLLGRHFIRDVVAGAVSGSLCGALGMLIVNFY